MPSRCIYVNIYSPTSPTVGSPPSTHSSSRPALSMDAVTNVSMDYQFLDPQTTLDVLDMDAFFSWSISAVEDVNLSGALPLDMALFKEDTDWATDAMDTQHRRLPRQIGSEKLFDEGLSPLEGFFPSADQALRGSPDETSVFEEVRSG